MKVFAITVGDQQAGSTKYRLMDYVPFLQQHGISVECVAQKDLKLSHLTQIAQADLLFNQKCLIEPKLTHAIICHSKRIIFDFDDAIYTRPGKPYFCLTQWRVNARLKLWLQASDHVIAANHFLSSYAEKHTSNAVVIPMALSEQTWQVAAQRAHKAVAQKAMTIGWAGAPSNLPHLERIEPVLRRVLSAFPHVQLAVFSGKRPQLSCPYAFTPFQEGQEAPFIQQLDIGLLPLTEEEFSKGKSPIKALQYLACGIPVVGNVYGASREILNARNSIAVESFAEWSQALHHLIENPAAASQMGLEGRSHFEKNYSREKTQLQLLHLLLNGKALPA